MNNHKRIGILGGTFNPIHNGHLILAQNAAEECSLDTVLFMPAGISYLKDQSLILSAEHRNIMTKLAISGNPLFELSTIETDRIGNSYTYVTIEELISKNNNIELFYIFGADILFSIEKWVKPEVIFSNSTLICSARDHYTNDELIQQKEYLESKYNAKIIFLDSTDVDISSSYIRKLIKAGRSAKYYLPLSVEEYIKEHNLYKDN